MPLTNAPRKVHGSVAEEAQARCDALRRKRSVSKFFLGDPPCADCIAVVKRSRAARIERAGKGKR